jgi:hypothetical protein
MAYPTLSSHNNRFLNILISCISIQLNSFSLVYLLLDIFVLLYQVGYRFFYVFTTLYIFDQLFFAHRLKIYLFGSTFTWYFNLCSTSSIINRCTKFSILLHPLLKHTVTNIKLLFKLTSRNFLVEICCQYFILLFNGVLWMLSCFAIVQFKNPPFLYSNKKTRTLF